MEQQEKTTGQIIWDTMHLMRQHGQEISRQRLMELTGLKYTLIDDHVSRWIEEGRLRRVVDGVYEFPAPEPEPRPVLFTDLPDGTTIIEVGEQILQVSRWELHAISLRSAGNSIQFGNQQTRSDMAAMYAEAMVRIRNQADQICDLQRQLLKVARAASPQMDLLGEQT